MKIHLHNRTFIYFVGAKQVVYRTEENYRACDEDGVIHTGRVDWSSWRPKAEKDKNDQKDTREDIINDSQVSASLHGPQV